MNKFIALPNGDSISNVVLKSVRHLKGRGVACSDAQQRLVVWIEVADTEKAFKVRDIMARFMKEPRGIPQPDWSFLNDEAVAVVAD